MERDTEHRKVGKTKKKILE